jgi:hypothetical protein
VSGARSENTGTGLTLDTRKLKLMLGENFIKYCKFIIIITLNPTKFNWIKN